MAAYHCPSPGKSSPGSGTPWSTRPRFERPGPYQQASWKDLPMSISKEHILLRFQAVVIASQLPDNTAEALLILDYARQMVMGSLHSCGGSDNVQRVSGTVETQPVVQLARDGITFQ